MKSALLDPLAHFRRRSCTEGESSTQEGVENRAQGPDINCLRRVGLSLEYFRGHGVGRATPFGRVLIGYDPHSETKVAKAEAVILTNQNVLKNFWELG